MSRPTPSMQCWRGVALVAALLVGSHALAAAAAPVKKKPAGTEKAAGAKAQRPAITAAKGKGKGSASQAPKASKPTATAARPLPPQAKRKAGTVAKTPAKVPAQAAGKRPPASVAAVAPRPEPQLYIPPPLGPERYYPNGIPELRPEFMHPETPASTAQR